MARSVDPLHVRLFYPFERFFRWEAAGGVVLLATAVIALIWANSPFARSYEELWHTQAGLRVGGFALEKDLLHWVNDGLMAIFFLLVGLEIKREFLKGELSTRAAATLPAAAALGGMVVPALIYTSIAFGTPAASGWGIPMATDIAFALGAVALLGRSLPGSLRIFLAAAAIVDDLGAVMVIALFYTPELHMVPLLVAGLAFALLVLFNRTGVHRLLPYLVVGAVLWVMVLKSGVHATIAGVLLAMTIPARPPAVFAVAGGALDALTKAVKAGEAPGVNESVRESTIMALEKAAEVRESLLLRMEHALVPWVAFGVMPIFALANAGVHIEGSILAIVTTPAALGIMLGLVIGKQVGFLAFSWLAVRTGLAKLPTGAGWAHVWGIGWLAGIGFTMALFIANLGLPEELQANAKLAILMASLVSGVGGMLILSWIGKRYTRRTPAAVRTGPGA